MSEGAPRLTRRLEAARAENDRLRAELAEAREQLRGAVPVTLDGAPAGFLVRLGDEAGQGLSALREEHLIEVHAGCWGRVYPGREARCTRCGADMTDEPRELYGLTLTGGAR